MNKVVKRGVISEFSPNGCIAKTNTGEKIYGLQTFRNHLEDIRPLSFFDYAKILYGGFKNFCREVFLTKTQKRFIYINKKVCN